MIHRIFPVRDTFVTNTQRNRTQQTGSNFGAAESLDLFKLAGVSGTIGVAGSASVSRVLMQFDFSSIAALTASGEAPSSGVQYWLKLRHATTAETLPSSYDVTVHPVTTAWDEGKGLDVETFYDKGFANWVKPKQATFWTAQGGDFSTTNTASYHFDDGFEDLDVDVTSMVNSWLVSGTVNNGLMVKLTGSVELSSEYNDYYIKRFYSRTTSFDDRKPFIEARWDDSVKDDRANFVFGRTGSLALYNVVNGQLTNLSIGSSSLIVRIADASGTLLTLTGSFSGRTGIYSASFALPTGSAYSGSVFYDRWGSGSFSFMTGTLQMTQETASTAIQGTRYVASMRNLKSEYDVSEHARLTVTFKDKTFVPTVVLTASAAFAPRIAFKSYYAVENDSTRERVIQFGTGSIETTRLSYDANGNYFKLRMANLHSGNVYRILLLVDDSGQRQLIDESFKFKVS